MVAPHQWHRTFRFGVFELDARSGELRKYGLRVKLQEQPFQVLLLLLERPGQVVTREELRQRLWPLDTFVDFDVGLNSAIKRVRDALEDSSEKPRFVETLPRHGYRFLGAVEEAHAGQIQSLAVLPLANFTGNPGQEYWVDGITDALITDLAQIGGLRVISRTSAMQYKGAAKPLPEIARELKVDAVVEGAVVRSGRRVRISAQLIDATTDRHLWARTYERDLGDVMALQGEIARAIAQEIEVKLTPQVRARLTSPRRLKPDAYDSYLKARYHTQKQTAAGYVTALRYFERTIAREPHYAPAHAGLSGCHRLLTFFGPRSPQESMPPAEAAARKALELDETLAEAHAALAAIAYRFRWNWAESERGFRRALELSPNDAECHRMYSIFLWSAGRFQEALGAAQHARELDPALPSIHDGFTFLWAREHDRAIAEFRRALDRDPDLPHAHFGLGLTYALRGDFHEGIRELKTAVRLSRRHATYLSRLGHTCAAAGDEGQARKILEELRARAEREYVSPVGIALVHLGLGDKEAALTCLEEAYRVRDFDLVTRNPRFDPLRPDPRFQELMRRIGLPTAASDSEKPG